MSVSRGAGNSRKPHSEELSTIENFVMPLADRRSLDGLGVFTGPMGDERAARLHREISRATNLRSADTERSEESLQKTFLSGLLILRVLAHVVPVSSERR